MTEIEVAFAGVVVSGTAVLATLFGYGLAQRNHKAAALVAAKSAEREAWEEERRIRLQLHAPRKAILQDIHRYVDRIQLMGTHPMEPGELHALRQIGQGAAHICRPKIIKEIADLQSVALAFYRTKDALRGTPLLQSRPHLHGQMFAHLKALDDVFAEYMSLEPPAKGPPTR